MEAVIVTLVPGGASASPAWVEGLEDRLRARLAGGDVGEYDGNVLGPGEAVLYLYGPSAERLWSAIADLFDPVAVGPTSYVVRRYGEPGAREERFELATGAVTDVTPAPPKQRVREGDWFAAPLEDGRFVAGRVARYKAPTAFAYFFAPPFDRVPSLEDVAHLEAADSFTQMRFSHLGLRDGRWPVIGGTTAWDPAEWPMVEFERLYEWPDRPSKLFAIRYDERELGRQVEQRPIDLAEAGKRPSDASAGAVAAIVRLRRELPESRG